MSRVANGFDTVQWVGAQRIIDAIVCVKYQFPCLFLESFWTSVSVQDKTRREDSTSVLDHFVHVGTSSAVFNLPLC